MWWPFAWLSLGFGIKWIREWWERNGKTMFDFVIVIFSFALVYLLFGVMAVTTWQAFIVLLFWLIMILMLKVE